METRRKVNKQLDIGDRRKVDRRSGADRRSGWDKTEGHLLRGTLAATASMVFQFSRPFTIILGYVDLLLNRSKEKHTKQKLVIIKEQLEIISEILDDFREVDDFKTKNFDGMEILDTKRLMEEEPNKLDRKIL
jgi:signal transduction histidine kinase